MLNSQVVLVMDQREQLQRKAGKGRTECLLELVQRIRDKGILVDTSQTLPVGDVVWVARYEERSHRIGPMG